MTEGVVLWLALLLVLLGLFALTARRMSVLIRRTRDLERVQRSVDSMDRRLAVAIDPVVIRLDEIRRRSGDAHRLAQEIGAAQSMLRELAAEAGAIRLPVLLQGQATIMAHETQRAVRAADLVGHGLDALLTGRGNRDMEAQVALKRGALNLRHAREAFGRAAAEVGALRPADLAAHRDPRAHVIASTGPLPAPETFDEDLEAASEPRI
jgi:HAMP domain-containing protein